jgi:hypothetical protein
MRERFRAIANRARAIPGALGLRPTRVYILQAAWSGAHTGDGTKTAAEVEITEHGQPPKVSLLSDERRAYGDLPAGTLEIGPITPDHAGGGTALATLQPVVAAGTEVLVKLTGNISGLYRITKVNQDKALHWMLQVQAKAPNA